MLHQALISLFESQWSTLQMVVLREILLSVVRAGDPLAAWSAAARLLRSYYPLITPVGQNGLASALSNSADRLPSGTRSADPALPFIRLHSFPLHQSQMDIVKRNSAKEDWWAGSAPSGPFIYTPFSKGEPNNNSKQELIWVVGNLMQVRAPSQPVVVSIPILHYDDTESTKASRRQLKEAIYTTLFNMNVPAVCAINQATLALYAARRTSGIVVNIGFQVTSVVPILHGKVMRKVGVEVVGLGALKLTGFLKELMQQNNISFESLYTVRTLKEVQVLLVS
ncbi:trafficking protein particle complex II-specific subunit 120 homolog [Humulus lupulus]|uniref:trafficking protein particle complex II-specific subunit 120 homolog n=1 Tax=Humulus lupulus TaxID=3486 RepID=UPI002B4128DF|nr:trafficking protein particle complex II-specific subunit 120 homolog [Humulus lupulus]